MTQTVKRPTRAERRAAARARREERERAAAAAAARRRRLIELAAVTVAAVALVAIAIAFQGAGDDTSSGDAPVGSAESAALLRGIPQDGTALGRPDAPVTLIEFADLQCPFCRDYSVAVMPEIVEKYVRTGKVRLELRVLRFLGEDSERAAQLAAAATQDRMWQFVDIFYRNQGTENSGYADDDFLRGIARGARMNVSRAMTERSGEAAEHLLVAAEEQAGRAGISSTPSFLVGPTDGRLEQARGAFAGDRVVPAHARRTAGPLVDGAARSITGAGPEARPRLRSTTAIGVLAAVGIAVAAYLTWVHYAGIEPLCTRGSDCGRVQSSEYAELFGVPVALVGLVGYAAILGSLRIRGDAGLVGTAFLALVGLAFTAYLTWAELFRIGAVCQWCLFSAGLMTIIAVIAVVRLLRP